MTPTNATRLAAAVAAATLLAGACSSSSSDDEIDASGSGARPPTDTADAAAAPPPDAGAAELAWPGTDWPTTDAAAAGLDQAELDAMAADADAAESHCLVVTRDGELVDEWYFDDWDARTEQEVFSATKSVTSTLVGIAQDRGLLDIDEPASTYITEWQGTPSEGVTIRNLISNDSGRFQDFPTDYIDMASLAEDKTQFSIDLDQQHEPGTEWVYNNAAIQTLDRVLEEATGMPTAEFATEALFEPLGMASHIATDPTGNALMFMGAQMSCQDLARYGLLFLRGGTWDGEQVVSAEWVAEATTPSQELNEAYGFLWWLNTVGTTATAGGSASEAGQLVDGAPEDVYAALGLGNQLLVVFPSSGVVATRIGTQLGVGASEQGPQFGVGDLVTHVQAALGEPVDGGGDGSGASDGATGAG